MPENIAVFVAVACVLLFFVLCAALLFHVLIKLREQNVLATDSMRLAVKDLAARMNALEDRIQQLNEDLVDFRLAENGRARDSTSTSLEAIRAAKNGADTREIMQKYKLREAEASLLVTVYGLDDLGSG